MRLMRSGSRNAGGSDEARCRATRVSGLDGAGELISKRRIRYIIFEDAMFLETDTKRLLIDAGYQVFKLDSRILGPHLTPWHAWKNRHLSRSDDGIYCDFIATFLPDDLTMKFRRRGFLCL